MLATAYVLISVQSGKAPMVHNRLQKMQGVRQVDIVFGPYDMIAIVEGSDSSAIGRLVLDELSQVEGVLDTITCNVIAILG